MRSGRRRIDSRTVVVLVAVVMVVVVVLAVVVVVVGVVIDVGLPAWSRLCWCQGGLPSVQ